jgi:2-hydroxychromene-2-carboxylate isomerase
MFPPLGAQTPAWMIFRISSFGTASGFNRRIDRVVQIISKRSVGLAISFQILYSSGFHALFYTSRNRTESSGSAIMGESPPIDFWLSMGSTYTYLTVMRLSAVETTPGVQFRWRPFNLRSIFDTANYFPFPAGSPKTAYMWRDIERRATSYGIPIRVPAPYPSKNSALTNRVALVGSQEGWVKDFALAAYRQWFQLGEEAGTETHIRSSLDSIGQDPQRVVDFAQSERIQRLWDAETDRARELGVFGSPTFVVDGELFWGDDRLEDTVSWHRHGRVVRQQPDYAAGNRKVGVALGTGCAVLKISNARAASPELNRTRESSQIICTPGGSTAAQGKENLLWRSTN